MKRIVRFASVRLSAVILLVLVAVQLMPSAYAGNWEYADLELIRYGGRTFVFRVAARFNWGFDLPYSYECVEYEIKLFREISYWPDERLTSVYGSNRCGLEQYIGYTTTIDHTFSVDLPSGRYSVHATVVLKHRSIFEWLLHPKTNTNALHLDITW